jgi:hypothetical protein
VFGRIGALRPVHADIGAKYFDYKQVEEKMYKWWDETGHMKPMDAATVAEGFIHTNNSNSKNESFCIPMPPPNVTGSLHIGFVYSVTFPLLSSCSKLLFLYTDMPLDLQSRICLHGSTG